MAPPKTPTRNRKQLPDGAKGVEVVDREKYSINVDEDAKTREAGVITIGELDWFRQRKTWEITLKLEELITQQNRITRRAARYEAQIDKLEEEIAGVQDTKTGEWKVEPCDDARFEEIEGEIDELATKKTEATLATHEASLEILALLLRDEGGSHPDTLFLKNSLDSGDFVTLARKLARGGEPVEGPTPTETEPNGS